MSVCTTRLVRYIWRNVPPRRCNYRKFLMAAEGEIGMNEEAPEKKRFGGEENRVRSVGLTRDKDFRV